MVNGRRESHANRYHQIAHTLMRHGLGYLVGVVGLERFVPFHKGMLGHPRRAQPYTQPEHDRMALEDLGPTFIKLGQILSTRQNLLPKEYQVELAKLQDQAPAVPPDSIRDVICTELARPIEEVFTTFETEPLAAASIGQAHGATLPDGTEVVVKVRRPKLVEVVEEDLEILQNLAAAASRRWERANEYDLVGLAQEFAQTLRGELDYIREGRNAERFAANFQDDPQVHIPRVFWDSTTSRMLTLERVRGMKINDLAELEAAGINRPALARRASQILLKMIFDDGLFHADPHPGNFFVESGGTIGLIDFGMVGTVDERTQDQLARLFLAITAQDADRLVDAFLDLGVGRQRVDRALLRRDLEHLVRYYALPPGRHRAGTADRGSARSSSSPPPAITSRSCSSAQDRGDERGTRRSTRSELPPYQRARALRAALAAPRVFATEVGETARQGKPGSCQPGDGVAPAGATTPGGTRTRRPRGGCALSLPRSPCTWLRRSLVRDDSKVV